MFTKATSSAGPVLPPGTTLLGVWAHPDDEAYLSAGLMAEVTDGGGRVVCAFATRGEAAGGPNLSVLRAAYDGDRRAIEARAALAVAGVHDVRFLGHGDGRCADVDAADGARQIARLIEEIRPDVVVTFGSDGITGHPDHQAVSAWTIGAAAVVSGNQPAVWCAAMTGTFLDRHAEMHERIGLFGYGSPARRTPDAAVVAQVRLEGATLDRKRAALRAHGSQTEPLAQQVGERVYRTWWEHETFRAPTAAEVMAAVAAEAA